MLYKAFSHSCQGASHIRSAIPIPCQDFSFADDKNEGFAFAIVSDGHGSEKHFRSSNGSEIACEVSKDIIKDFFTTLNDADPSNPEFAPNHDLLLRQLAANIIVKWQIAIDKHFKENVLTEEEEKIYNKYYGEQKGGIDFKIYGATFVLAAMSDQISFILQTGDSPCLVFDNEYNCRIPPQTINPNCVMGYTTSLSNSNALEEFRYYRPENGIKAIFVCSDGVTDSYSNEDFLKFGTVLLKEFEADYDNALNYVKEWLPKLSEKGSGDDMSIAGIYAIESEE